jgi:hypothetical protein
MEHFANITHGLCVFKVKMNEFVACLLLLMLLTLLFLLTFVVNHQKKKIKELEKRYNKWNHTKLS